MLKEEMEMPTPCQKCNEIFDLQDGTGSEKWFPNTVICQECGDKEQVEMDRDDEIEELKIQLDDAIFTVNDCRKSLKRYGIDVPLPELNLPKSWAVV